MKEHISSSLPPPENCVVVVCVCCWCSVCPCPLCAPPWPPSATHRPFYLCVVGLRHHALPDLADTASLAWRAFACKLCFALVHAPIYPWLDTHTQHTQPAATASLYPASHPHHPLPPLHTASRLSPSFTTQDEDHHVLRGLPGPADGTPRPGPRRPHHGGAREDGVLELRPRK